MASLQSFNTIAVAPSNVQNGASTTYSFDVTSPVALLSTDVLYMTFPTEIGLKSPSCTGISPVSASCTSPSTGVLKVVLTFSGGYLSESTKFTFSVSGVTNAPSTKTTSAFSNIYIEDASGS